MTQTVSLNALLITCADAWAKANDSSTGVLGRRVVKDNRFFTDLRDGRDPGLGKVEAFARFLHDSANWPDGVVPQEVCELAHRVGVSANASSVDHGEAA